MSKPVAMTHLAQWFNQIEFADIDSFQIIKRTFENHYQNIISFLDNRSTNAAAESFNAKIKDFRRQFRGVVYRLYNEMSLIFVSLEMLNH